MADLVTYNNKHNSANGEDNKDGESHNNSWNCGQVYLCVCKDGCIFFASKLSHLTIEEEKKRRKRDNKTDMNIEQFISFSRVYGIRENIDRLISVKMFSISLLPL